MCGIIGFVDKKKKLSVSERKALMGKMLDEIIYRGRDASGIYENNGVVIGHNRLAILDISKKANQPLSTEDGNLIISYNGEIFNHLEMRESAVRYLTNSDTETFLHMYKRHNKKAFESIRGMFAVNFYKPQSNKITLSVDSFSIKPLYYLNTEDWFAWSSELKVFKHLEGFNFSINEERLFEYGVFRVIAGSETMLKGICKLMPSEIIEYDINSDSIIFDTYHRSAEVGKANLEELLTQSVSECILSDVPIGFQLSGGVDSSLISVIAKKVLKQKEVHSFSIGLDDPKWNEFEYSREVSKLLGTTHHEIVFDQDYFCKNYPLAAYHLDEPVAYPNTVPIMLLSNIASNHVKVLLSGEGADELFGGYNRYRKFLSKSNRESIIYSNSFSTKINVHQFFKVDNIEIEVRSPWGDYDVLYKGKKIEVKCCSYIQDWDQSKLTTVQWSGLKAKKLYYSEAVTKFADVDKTIDYKSDIYILALFKHQEHATLDILDMDQWCFYVLSKEQLRLVSKDRGSVSLLRLEKESVKAEIFADLAQVIEVGNFI